MTNARRGGFLHHLTICSDLWVFGLDNLQEEIRQNLVIWDSFVDLVLGEVSDSDVSHNILVNEEVSGAGLGVSSQNLVSGIRHNVCGSAQVHKSGSSKDIIYSCSGDSGEWPESVDGDAILLVLVTEAETRHGHTVLGHGVRKVVSEPVGGHVRRWAKNHHMRVLGLLQVGNGELGDHEGSSVVDLVHEIPSRGKNKLKFGIFGICKS